MEMPDMFTSAAIAAKMAGEALPAAAGAAVSMRFLPDGLSRMERFTAALAAYAIGTYVGRGITAYLLIDNARVVDAIVFGVALFGMSFVGTLITEIKPAVKALRRKYAGELPEDDAGVK